MINFVKKSEDLMKSGKIRKPDKNLDKNIIISYLISKLSIMSRNIFQIIEIRRFEKSDKKQTNKKRDFQTSELRSRSKNSHFQFKSLSIFKCFFQLLQENSQDWN